MGLSLETLRASFPKSTAALRKHHELIDKLASCDADRLSLRLSANILALTIGDETLKFVERVKMAGKGVDFIRDLFGKK